MLRIGVAGANYGPNALSLPDNAQAAEEAGFDSIWLSDRVINPPSTSSPYPFTPDRRVPWPPEVAFLDPIVSLAHVAARTTRIELGFGVLVLPLRQPLVVAKQIASLDALSGGRVALGVGVGWMAEEFEAVGRDFATRGSQTEEAIRVLRAAWQGETPKVEGDFFPVAEGTWSIPTPAHDVPILIGGMTKPARRRAGSTGDGWFAFVSAAEFDPEVIRRGVDEMRGAATSAGRDPDMLRPVLRMPGPIEDVRSVVGDVPGAGVSDLIIDAPPAEVNDARALVDELRGAAAPA
jgi:probable F420-dependent oxidoreductase